MLSEVSSFLNRQNDRDLLGRSVVVTDCGADGNFLVHHFIAQALKDGHIVILVSFAQSFTHYSAVATKLGVSLSRQEELGSLVFVDCLSNLFATQGGSDAGEVKGQARPTFSLDSDLSLSGLYKLLWRCVLDCHQKKPNKPVCLILDDLSVLVSVGVRLVEVVGLAQYCRQMVTGLYHKPSGYIVTMVHREGGEGEEDLLALHLLHTSHLALHVSGLPSGYSRDVHGQLTATWRSSSPPVRKEAQFKLSDRTVNLFAKGTSTAVL